MFYEIRDQTAILVSPWSHRKMHFSILHHKVTGGSGLLIRPIARFVHPSPSAVCSIHDDFRPKPLFKNKQAILFHNLKSQRPSKFIVTFLFQNAMDEVVATTAYLEIMLRRLTEPALLGLFLRFIVAAHHDSFSVLSTLINRLNSNAAVSPPLLCPLYAYQIKYCIGNNYRQC